MTKIRKIFASFSIFITNIFSKVFAFDLAMTVQEKYGVIDSMMYEQPKYGIFEPTLGGRIAEIGRIALPLVLFIIGLFVVLSKKLTKKIKLVVISVLIGLGIIGVVLIDYLSVNF